MLLWIVIGGLLLFLCGAVILEIVAGRFDMKRCPPPGRLVTVGGGQLHIHARGQGRPTVVFDAGLGDSGMVWADVQTKLAKTTRVCIYDRAGLGWSEPASGPRDGRRMSAEWRDLLDAAGESGPYVLVGHSSGCHQVRLFAAAFPEQVAGLVLIDPPVFSELSPAMTASVATARRSLALMARLGIIRSLARAGRMDLLFDGAAPPAEVARCAGYLYRPRALAASLAETAALPETIRQVASVTAPGAWRDWPVVILSAHKDNPAYNAVHQAHAELARLSSRGEQLSVDGSHFIHFQHPEVVAEAITRVVHQVREQ